MKMFSFGIVALMLSASVGQAATQFQCDNFSGRSGSRATLDLSAGSATYTMKGVTSELTLVSVSRLGEFGDETRHEFEGADASTQFGRIRINLNSGSRSADLIEVDDRENMEQIGSANCSELK